MPTASDMGLQIGPARPQVTPRVLAKGLSKDRAPQDRTDTLHCSSNVAVEVIQFTREVSAMPPNLTPHSTAPVSMATADTLPLR